MENIKFVVRSPYKRTTRVFTDLSDAKLLAEEWDKYAMYDQYEGNYAKIHKMDEEIVKNHSLAELKWKCTPENWVNVDGCNCTCGCNCVRINGLRPNPENCWCFCVPNLNSELWENYTMTPEEFDESYIEYPDSVVEDE